jgi:hypothetical protein
MFILPCRSGKDRTNPRKEGWMHRVLIITTLLLTVGLAANTEIVTFENSWAQKPLFNVVSSTPAGVDIIFSTGQMVIEETTIDGAPMQTIGVPGIFLPNNEGAPNLAGTGRYIAVPEGARATVTVVRARKEVYHNIDIAPAPELPLDRDDSPLRYEKDMSIYNRNAFYPHAPVTLSEPGEIRGVDVVMLGITPFQYNPVTRELIVYKDIQVRIDFYGGNGRFGEDRLRSRFWEPVFQQHLLNYSSLPQIDFYAPKKRYSEADGYEYIIIVPNDAVFESWANTIKTFRQEQGISTEVFTLSEIGGSSSSAIENFLNNAYNTWDPAPAAFLILSDYPSSGDAYGVTSPYWNSYCVSDNIYADVDGDGLPDMHHARICAQTETQLSTMINKFVDYETNPCTDAGFYEHPLVACGWQTERWFQLCTEVIRGFFVNGLGKDPVRQYNVYLGAPEPGCEWSTNSNTSTVVNYFYNLGWLPSTTNPYSGSWWANGSASGVTSAINNGAFIVQHRDHGGTTGWGEPNYNMSDLDNLTNDELTFVYSVNCLTGMYDNSSEVFAEKFHRIEHGALGINAASEISYSFVNDTYVWGTYDYLWPQFDPGYGATGSENLMPCPAMASGKYYLQASSWPYNTSNKAHTYNLFHHHGDAFMVIYSEIPQNLSVSHATTLPAGQTYFTVSANSGSIIALTVNGEIIGVAQGTGSSQSIQIPAQNSGTMKVVVTKSNYYRYSATVPISGGTPVPNLVIESVQVTGGNGNGVLEPGETADLVVSIRNTGSASASNVNSTLTTSSSYITINDGSYGFGTIGVNAIANNSSDPYTVTASSSTPVGATVSFDIDIVAGSYSTTLPFNLQIGGTTTEKNYYLWNPDPTPTPGQNMHVILGNLGYTGDYGTALPSDLSVYDAVLVCVGMYPENYVITSSSAEASRLVDYVQNQNGNLYLEGGDVWFYDPIAQSGYDFGPLFGINAVNDGSSDLGPVLGESGTFTEGMNFTSYTGENKWVDRLESEGTGYVILHDGDNSYNCGIANDAGTYRTVGTSFELGLLADGASPSTRSELLDEIMAFFGVGGGGPVPPAFSDDFDDGNANGWTVSGLWHVTSYRANSPSYSLAYNKESDHTYNTGSVTSGAAEFSVDLPSEAVLEFYHCYWTESLPAPFDICRVEMYYGGSWLTLAQWDSRDPNVVTWTHVAIDLSSYSGTVQIRFYFDSRDQWYNDYEGWYIDNIVVRSGDSDENMALLKPALHSEQGDPRDLLPISFSARCIPNPFKATTAINFAIPAKTNVDLTIYNAIGQEIKKLVHGETAPGYHRALWDGKDVHGRQVNAGIYFYKIECEDSYENIEKIIFVK